MDTNNPRGSRIEMAQSSCPWKACKLSFFVFGTSLCRYSYLGQCQRFSSSLSFSVKYNLELAVFP